MKCVTFIPDMFEGRTTINRSYTVLEIKYSDFNEDERNLIIQESEKLADEANQKASNSGEQRNSIVMQNDAYAGILAEFAVLKLLNKLLPNSATRPPVTTAINQIDISWLYNDKPLTIEVRSSFVKNGIPFGLFAIDPNTRKPYFDVLGPYYQDSYKTQYESTKDGFARVLFNNTKYDVYKRFIINDESFYVIGFMDGPELTNLEYHKSLKPGSAFTKHGNLDGDFYVAPINKIKDIKDIANNILLKKDNPFI